MISAIKAYLKLAMALRTPFIFLLDAKYKVLELAEFRAFYATRLVQHQYIPEFFDCEVAPELAWALGLFYADGSCGLRNGKPSGANWRIVNANEEYLVRAKAAFEGEWPDFEFPLRTYRSYAKGQLTNYGERKRQLHCLEVAPQERHNDSSRGEFIRKFRATTYIFKEKKVPAGILESLRRSKRAFLEGVIAGDGTKGTSRFISVHGGTSLGELVKLMLDLRWLWYFRKDNGNDNYRLYFTRRFEQKDLSKVGGCDDYAWLMKALANHEHINGVGFVIGWVKWVGGGLHAWNVGLTDKGVYQLEPQTGMIFRRQGQYRPLLVIL